MSMYQLPTEGYYQVANDSGVRGYTEHKETAISEARHYAAIQASLGRDAGTEWYVRLVTDVQKHESIERVQRSNPDGTSYMQERAVYRIVAVTTTVAFGKATHTETYKDLDAATPAATRRRAVARDTTNRAQGHSRGGTRTTP